MKVHVPDEVIVYPDGCQFIERTPLTLKWRYAPLSVQQVQVFLDSLQIKALILFRSRFQGFVVQAAYALDGERVHVNERMSEACGGREQLGAEFLFPEVFAPGPGRRFRPDLFTEQRPIGLTELGEERGPFEPFAHIGGL